MIKFGKFDKMFTKEMKEVIESKIMETYEFEVEYQIESPVLEVVEALGGEYVEVSLTDKDGEHFWDDLLIKWSTILEEF